MVYSVGCVDVGLLCHPHRTWQDEQKPAGGNFPGLRQHSSCSCHPNSHPAAEWLPPASPASLLEPWPVFWYLLYIPDSVLEDTDPRNSTYRWRICCELQIIHNCFSGRGGGILQHTITNQLFGDRSEHMSNIWGLANSYLKEKCWHRSTRGDIVSRNEGPCLLLQCILLPFPQVVRFDGAIHFAN